MITDIYKQTQNLAMEILNGKGYISDVPITHRETSGTPRKESWDLAMIAQEFLNGHEMVDIVEEYEEYFENLYIAIDDNEALVELGNGNGVYVRAKEGNSDGFKLVKCPKEFVNTCYHHCTVYKIQKRTTK